MGPSQASTAGQWTAADQLRLRALLAASGVALISTFLPLLLIDSFESDHVWRSLGGLHAIYTAGITIHRYRQSRAIDVSGSVIVSGVPAYVLQTPVIILMCSNAAWLASASVYVAGVLWGLFITFVVFARLLLAAARREAG